MTTLESSFKQYLSAHRSATELGQELEVRTQWAKNALAAIQTTYGANTEAARKRLADLSIELIKLNLEMIALASPQHDASSRVQYVAKLLDPQVTAIAQSVPVTTAPSPAHTASGTAGVVQGLKQAAQAALSKLPKPGAAPAPTAPQQAWPFPVGSNKLQNALAGSGILPASKSTASATQAKTLDTDTRKVYVNIRKHPQGFSQPTGKRVLRKVEINPDGTISIGIGKDGKQGWTIGKTSDISFLDFHVGHERGVKVSLNGVVKYLESGVTDTRA